MSDPLPEFMTVTEIAATLKLNQQTIRNWIDAGTLPHVRVGRRVRVYKHDFDALLADGYDRGAPADEPAPSIWDGTTNDPIEHQT